jgi:hypothetical protein
MAKFIFEPPLRLTRGITVHTLEQAAAFARNLIDPQWPLQRAGVLRRLEAASGHERERDAANAFRAWAEAEGLARSDAPARRG